MTKIDLAKLRAILRLYQEAATDAALDIAVAQRAERAASNVRLVNLDLAADEIRAAWAVAHPMPEDLSTRIVVSRIGARGYGSPDLQAWWVVVRGDVLARLTSEAPVDCAPVP